MKHLKNKLILLSILSALVFTTSCNQDEIDKLTQLNTELREQSRISDSLQGVFLTYFVAIESNLDEIKLKEESISRMNTANNLDRQDQILIDIQAISKLMDDNRKKIKNLEKVRRELVNAKTKISKLSAENTSLKNQLNESAKLSAENEILKNQLNQTSQVIAAPSELNNSERQQLAREKELLEAERNRLLILSNQNQASKTATLEKEKENENYRIMIDKLKNQLLESEARIESLQEELFMMKEAYAALQVIADSLRIQNDTYREEITKKDILVKAQADAINSGYYAIGSIKELRNRDVIRKDKINNAYPVNGYVKINIFEQKLIETKSSRIKILSSHPIESYQIVTEDKSNYKIQILNPDSFWKGTRYLIVSAK